MAASSKGVIARISKSLNKIKFKFKQNPNDAKEARSSEVKVTKSLTNIYVHALVSIILITALWFVRHYVSWSVTCPSLLTVLNASEISRRRIPPAPVVDDGYYIKLYDNLRSNSKPMVYLGNYSIFNHATMKGDILDYIGDKPVRLNTVNSTVTLTDVTYYDGNYRCPKTTCELYWVCSCVSPEGVFRNCRCATESSCCSKECHVTWSESKFKLTGDCIRSSNKVKTSTRIVYSFPNGSQIYNSLARGVDIIKEVFNSEETITMIALNVPTSRGNIYSWVKLGDNQDPNIGYNLDEPTRRVGRHDMVALLFLGRPSRVNDVVLSRISKSTWKLPSPLGRLALNSSVYPCEIESNPCTEAEREVILNYLRDGAANRDLKRMAKVWELENEAHYNEISKIVENHNENLKDYVKFTDSLLDDISNKESSFLRFGYLEWLFISPLSDAPVIEELSLKDLSGIDYGLSNNSELPRCIEYKAASESCVPPVRNTKSKPSLNTILKDVLDHVKDIISPIISYISVASLVSQLVWVIAYSIPIQLSAKLTKVQKIVTAIRALLVSLSLLIPFLVIFSSPTFFLKIFGMVNVTTSQLHGIVINNCEMDIGDLIKWRQNLVDCNELELRSISNLTNGCKSFSRLPISFPVEYEMCNDLTPKPLQCAMKTFKIKDDIINIADIYFIIIGGWVGALLSSLPLVVLSVMDCVWLRGWIIKIKSGNKIDTLADLQASIRKEWFIRSVGPFISLAMTLSASALSYWSNYVVVVGALVIVFVIILISLIILMLSIKKTYLTSCNLNTKIAAI